MSKRLFRMVLMLSVVWVTASTSVLAQSGSHCNVSINTVTDPNATFTLLGVVGLTNYYCLGDPISASASYTNTDGEITTTTTASDCSTTVDSNSCSISLITANCTWTASVGSWSTNGTGISASFKPTDCGSGSVSFNVGWTNSCDGTTGSGGASGDFTVVAVDGLAPEDLPAGQGGLEAGSDPPTYWVCPCPGDVIVKASSCPSLTADQLPDCWTFTGGVTIDKLHHKVSQAALLAGPVTFTVSAGTSTKTIILKTDKERASYDTHNPSGECLYDNFPDPSPYHDKCGYTLSINCVGAVYQPPCIWPFQTCTTGHFDYRYNGIWVGTCYYPGGNNVFLFKTTKHQCRILRTWHLTQWPKPPPTFWTVTKYDCLTGTLSPQNCRTKQTWDAAWGRPADELLQNPGYPANSCENQGDPSTPCPPW